MRHALPALLLLAACGGSAPPPQQPQPDAPDDSLTGAETEPVASGDSEMAQRVCAAIDTMNKQGCEFLAGYDTTIEACVEDISAAQGDPLTMAIAGCFDAGATCASAETCVNEAMMAGMLAEAGGTECTHPEPHYGLGAKKFADTPTSMDQPIEVCGWPAQTEWLRAAKCNDGSNPFTSQDQAHDARAGSMGAGGRCGKVIDLYEVTCPEGKYEVYMDMYACN